MIFVENKEYLSEQLITYLGNKRKLLDFIGKGLSVVKTQLGKDVSILDGFAGSGIVSRYFKSQATKVISNDMEKYSAIISNCYLENKSNVDMKLISEINTFLNAEKLNGKFDIGLIEELYSPKDDNNITAHDRVFYTQNNAKIIDNIRRMIDAIDPPLQKFFLAPLFSEASIKNNTSGVFKGFYKNKNGIGQFGGDARNCLQRIMTEIVLPLPIFSQFECDFEVYNSNINDIIKDIEVDVAYYDPPYNQHPYGSNYFMLNIIASYERPSEISKVSGIPSNWNKSSYNKKSEIGKSFEQLISDTNAKFIMVSYNNEGFLNQEELMTIFSKYGDTQILEQEYNTFRGSRNLKNRNKKVNELLFIIKKY